MTIKILSESTVRVVRVAHPHTSNGVTELANFLNDTYGARNWEAGPPIYVEFGAPAERNIYLTGEKQCSGT